MLLVVDGDIVRAVATDGHRLALCEVAKDGAAAAGRIEAIVPRKTILELARLLPDSEEPVRVQMATNQVKFTFGAIELVSKLVEGKFPDYAKVVPANNRKIFVVGRELLSSALQRAAILTTDKFKGVRCILAPGSLKISSTNADQEEAQEELEIDYGGEGLDIGFNVTYLLDVLGNLKSENVRFALGDALGSALVTMPDSEKFKYVVMPMRI
jgi:DNA polymerase-3 subunit beta